MTVINILLLLSASGLIISGIILSSYIFSFLGIDKGLAFARTLHMVSSYWYFVLSSLHLGLHWNRVINSINKYSGGKRSVIRTVMLNTAAISMSCFGIHVFIQQQIASYMFMRTFFVYFDFEKSPLLFFVEYLCMMVMFASASYYFSKLPRLHKIFTEA